MSYDLQCYSVKREEKVLAVDVHLATPDNESVSRGAANPMEDIGYSRFVLTMIDKTSGKTIAPFGNIPAAEISYVKSVKDLALQQKILHPAAASAKENGEGRGNYTSTFAFGRFRGKTVVDVLLDPAGGLEALLKEREFLAQKAAQYPKNKAMLDEIDRLQAEIHLGTFDPAKHRGRPADHHLRAELQIPEQPEECGRKSPRLRNPHDLQPGYELLLGGGNSEWLCPGSCERKRWNQHSSVRDRG